MIIGHKKQLNFLLRSLENGHLNHAYLFSGPEGIGKFFLSKKFANKIINSQEKFNPDLIIIEPEEITKRGITKEKRIEVDKIREIQKELALFPHSGKFKVLIINNSHKLTVSSQNALLKSIEEPNSSSIIILITHNEEEILPTVKSRCQKINFNLVHTEMIKEEIQKKVNDNIQELAFFSMGRPGVAMSMINDEDFFNRKKKDFEEFKGIHTFSVNEKFKLADKYSKNIRQTLEKLEFWIWIFRYQIYRNLNKKNKMAKFNKSIGKIETSMKSMTETNANSRLILENLFLDL